MDETITHSSKNHVLITGASKGIGLAVAKRLAQEGYKLLLTYASDHKRAREVAQELKESYGVELDILQADSCQEESIGRIKSFAESKGMRFDALILNAGITCRSSYEEITLEDWQRVFFANLHFPMFLSRALLPLMQPKSSMIFTGSMMGIYPHGMALPYGVSKTAVHALVKNLVKHLEPYGIRVNAIAPGFVDTEWQINKPQEIRKSIESKLALHRFASPEEIADAFYFLMQNDYCNGEVLSLSGGYSYR